MLASLVSFSQNVINKADSVVVLDLRVAKEVVKDLVTFDGLRKEMQVTQELLSNLENRIILQQGIIQQYKLKESEYDQMIQNYKIQTKAYQGMSEDLKADLRKVRFKSRLGKAGLTLGLGLMTFLYITK